MPSDAPPAATPARAPEPGAAIVVAVYGAAAELDRCLASLAATTDLTAHPLVLSCDGPQPPEVEFALERRAAELGPVRVLRAERRAGFPVAANRGLAALPERDAVLLNSDVETTAGWLDRLGAAARSRAQVASVTPLTNHGTLASVPRWFEENALPGGCSLERFAALVERVAERRYPRLPTGVGFCLYLRRAALAAVGPLDAARFGFGYGEEVDWCLRASERGFVHLLDDATFVLHHGGASFGASRAPLQRRAERTVARRHPGYRARVAAFMAEDPVRPVRERIVAALRPAVAPAPGGRSLRVVHLVHGWPPWNHAGAESYAARLVALQARRHEVTVYARYAPPDRPLGSALERIDDGVRVRLIANRFVQRDPISRNAFHDRRLLADFARLLDETRPDLLHVHHLAGHALSLTRAAERRGVPIVWQLQDWWALCGRANLLDAGRRLCPGPSPRRCTACLPPTRLPPAPLWGPLLHWLRRALARRALGHAACFLAGSRGVVEDHRRLGLLPEAVPVHVCDYGVPTAPATLPASRRAGQPLRLGFIGTLAPHKGLHVAATALATLAPGDFRLEVWGEPREGTYAEEVRGAAGGAEIHFHPPFGEDELGRVLASIDLLLAPSLGLESYGLAVAEALAASVPVLASGRGALGERLAAGGGALFDPDRPETLAALLARVRDEPELLESWRRAIPAQRRFDLHVEEIEAIYRDVLARRRSSA